MKEERLRGKDGKVRPMEGEGQEGIYLGKEIWKEGVGCK